MYEATTHGIKIIVIPLYMSEQSDPAKDYFVWSYTVRIENSSDQTVQLRSRYWRITDALGKVQEVHGAGVVGEEPIITPGNHYVYSSGSPLATPSGFMEGWYKMEGDAGVFFNVDIPTFSLDSPHASRTLN